MQIFTLAAAVALGMVCAVTPALGAPPDSAPATLTVTGTALISRAPDQVRIDAAVVTNDPVATRALSENNAHYDALLNKLGTLGLTQNALKTVGLSTYFNPRPADAVRTDGQRYGYIVTRNLQLTTARVAQAGAAIDALTAAGATTVNGVSYGVHDERAAQRDAIAAAIADAGEQARAIAAAANVRIVRILRIGNEPAGPRPYPMMLGRASAGAKAAVPTDIPPENVEVQATIGVTYEIAQR